MGLRILSIFAAMALLVGCATLSNLNKNYSLGAKPTQSVVIIGVKPDDIRFGVEEGALVDDQFKWSATATPILAIYPEHGYVVAVMDATDSDEIYALTNLMESVHHYRACGAKPIDTFAIEPGKIVYLGDYAFAPPLEELTHTITYDPGSAEKFIRDNYPNLKDVPFVTEHVTPRMELGYRDMPLQALVHSCD